jgi:hypothetical protein
MVEIRWSRGPHTLRLGEQRVLPLPGGVVYAEGVEMRRFLAATGNSLTGREVAVFGAGDLSWFVVVSGAEGISRSELEWTEESREADGREVVIHSVLRGSMLFELVSEKSGAESARRSLEPILAGLRVAERPRSPWWPLLALPLVLLLFVRRRRGGGARLER